MLRGDYRRDIVSLSPQPPCPINGVEPGLMGSNRDFRGGRAWQGLMVRNLGSTPISELRITELRSLSPDLLENEPEAVFRAMRN